MAKQSKQRLSRADVDRRLVVHGVRDGRYAHAVGMRLLTESGLSMDEALAFCESVPVYTLEPLSQASELTKAPDLFG